MPNKPEGVGCAFLLTRYNKTLVSPLLQLGMSEAMIDIIRDYFATQPVLKAWLFGSYARGEETPESDVDILVMFDHDNAKIGLMQYCHIMNELSDRLDKKVDLVEDGTLLPFAERTANQDKKLIYERGR